MSLAPKLRLCLTLLVGAGIGHAQTHSLTTTFKGGNGHYGVMFNIEAKVPLRINSFDVHFADSGNPAPCASSCSIVEVEVYRVTAGGTFLHEINDPQAWTLLGSVQHTVTTALGTPQALALPVELSLDPSGTGMLGFYVTSTGPTNSVTGLANETQNYTNGTGVTYENTHASIAEGVGVDYPFGGSFPLRTWNGRVNYTAAWDCGTATSYCTAGVSASGCEVTLLTCGTASATAPDGFEINALGLDPAESGIFFWSSNGRQAQAWGSGTSFQCVVPPVIRGGFLISSATGGICDASMIQDLNAYWCPTCPRPAKNPGVGAVVQAQLWYRDPYNTSSQTTGLSDAVEFTVHP